ncbi:protein of unknown function (DUF461) [Pseudonocardia dioxanivorans CB1190]|jgi:hypothetical protein|uniref:Copper chaperone PCu(A)C n=1 Tax=Pseudonocardia dioxanivorans (strain ATCC 55486 / DSM 44775 / JCM 13855 / CB1190) TaxID=675635 RepID=F4CZC3_PSEUX|nr:copper chaperone PCu(A)C [Pseudonocardia dioxanivorans]AEA25654.1 protein of unknown function (DUF461) [Pseudonocardia dioxanivorans CB1190]
MTGSLTGCGAGQLAQTSEQQSAVSGASGDVGPGIALRDVKFPYPADPTGRYPVRSAVAVLAVIINHGSHADELVAVTSPYADPAQMVGTTQIPPDRNLVCGPDPAQPASPLIVGSVRVVLVTNTVLRAGLDTPVTFRFRQAGEVTLLVPMAA